MSARIAKNESVVVGVEMTGGKATVALIDKQGRVHQRCSAKTLRGRPVLAPLEACLKAVATILTYAQTEEFTVSCIGISIPGSLDVSARRPMFVPSLPSLNNFPLWWKRTRYCLPLCAMPSVLRTVPLLSPLKLYRRAWVEMQL